MEKLSKKTINYGLDDLFIALAHDKNANKTIHKFFVYMVSKIFNDSKSEQSENGGVLAENEIMSDLKMGKEEYEAVFNYFVINHGVFQAIDLQDGKKMWYLRNSSNWLLGSLGPNIRLSEEMQGEEFIFSGTDEQMTSFFEEIEKRFGKIEFEEPAEE